MFSDMLHKAVADGLVVIKSVHDLLPARVREVTDGWPEEVLVITIILVILLNIAFFLANVKVRHPRRPSRRVPRRPPPSPRDAPVADRPRLTSRPVANGPPRDLSQFHEMKHGNRAPASAKTTVEIVKLTLAPASPAKSPAAKKATAKTVAKPDAPASAEAPRTRKTPTKASAKASAKANPKAKAKAKPSDPASKTDPAAEKKFAEACGRWMHSLPARPKAKLLESLKSADAAERIAAYRASAAADATKTRAARKEELLAAIAALG